MENKNIILQELKEISPAVANISNRNLYSVPSGYFDTLSEEIFFQIRLAQISQKANLYSVPQGYFENLANEILLRVHETEVPKTFHPYSVPAEYFDGLAGSVMQKIKHEESNAGLPREVYGELQEIAPLLNSISKENLYAVPKNYFENLSIKLPVQKQPAKIISLADRTRRWVTYAAAACVISVMTIGGYLFFENKTGEIANEELYGKVVKMDLNQSMAALSDDEIMNYLNNQYTPFTDIIPPSEEEPDIQQLLENTSDEEIQQYLNENKEPDSKNIKGI